MKFSFENLGALDTGEVEIADLTVICGKNNTGKTYLTYTLYGFLRTWQDFLVDLPQIDTHKLRTTGVIEIDLKKVYLDKAKDLSDGAIANFTSRLHQVLAAQESRFETTKLGIEFSIPAELLKDAYEREYNSEQKKRLVAFSKAANSSILKVSALVEENDRSPRPSLRPVIEREIRSIIFDRLLPSPFIVSTERTGAVTFRSELNLAKNRLINYAHQVKADEAPDPMALIQSVLGTGYPLPVKDNVDFVNQLGAVELQTSPLRAAFPELLDQLEDILGGSYKLSKVGDIDFVPKGTRGVRLRMGESSSAVRSLVILSFYLRHLAKAGDLLMVDEPELNLHPANQRKLARLLARLVNAGVKVFVTTHSDYIIKEFNTLIMFNSDLPAIEKVRKDAGYQDADRLDAERTRLYVICEESVLRKGGKKKTKTQTVKLADVSPELGFSVPTFDKTIEEMNDLQQSLYYARADSQEVDERV